MNKRFTLLLTLCSFVFVAHAQTDSLPPDEPIDFSQFENAQVDNTVKRYCTSKVLGLSPNKLISIGYDFQGAQTIHQTAIAPAPSDVSSQFLSTGHGEVNSVGGLRIAANVPVISNTKWLVSVGASYWRMKYDFDHANNNYFMSRLKQNGLTTMGLNATVFKPFDEKHFLLAFGSADANGTYTLGDAKLMDYLSKPKITVAGFFGWKRNDRSMIAVGLSRTYRPGAKGIIPLILYNHTFENRKWGVEALFPARAALRRTLDARNLLFFGYELEGNSYSVINNTNNAYFNNLELRRSEIRPRITYERQLTGFIWLSAQAGYRINYSYNIDQGDGLRLLGSDDPYYMENTLTNTWYFQFSVNLVSP